MTIKIRVILLTGLILLLIWLIRQVRNRKLDLRYTLSWLLLVVALIILVIFPGILNAVSRVLGIYSPMNMLFFCGFVFALIIIYTLTVAVSKLSEEVKRLSQKIALMDKEDRKKREEAEE